MNAELKAFQDVLRPPEPEIDLGVAALLIAQVEYPALGPARWLARLDDLGRRSGVRDIPDPRVGLGRLARFLFEEEGFRGNVENYFDPRNSCLNDVLDRKLGIPITLSVLMIEVGRRVGLRIDGVGLPGHFVVRVQASGPALLIDPFNGGALLDEAGAAAVVARALGQRVTLSEAHFAPVSKLAIVTRMLANLKSIYVREEKWPRALAVIERLLLIERSAPGHLRDRGTVLMKLGDFHRGAADWERYLTRYPHAKDAVRLRDQLRRIRQALASVN